MPAPQPEAPRGQQAAGQPGLAAVWAQPRGGQLPQREASGEKAADGPQGPWGNGSTPAQALFPALANGDGQPHLQSYATAAGDRPADQPPAAAAPPPPAPPASGDWREYKTPDTGEKYYHNCRTGVTQWDRPEIGAVVGSEE